MDHPVPTYCYDLSPPQEVWSKNWYRIDVTTHNPITGRTFPYNKKKEQFRNDDAVLLTEKTTYNDSYTWKMLPKRSYRQPTIRKPAGNKLNTGRVSWRFSWPQNPHEEWKFNDPFKAKYPDPRLQIPAAYRKKLQEFYKEFNDYNEVGHQPAYQFTIHNNLMSVSPNSDVPKRYIQKPREPWNPSLPCRQYEERINCLRSEVLKYHLNYNNTYKLIKPASNHRPILKQYSADTHKPGGSNTVNFRVSSAPLSRAASSHQVGRPSTAREVNENTKPKKSDLHWMAWDTGNLEPPGLQKRCHKPWPSPEPPVTYGEKGRLTPSRPASRMASASGGKGVTTPPSVPRGGSARTPDNTCGDSGVPCAVDQQKVSAANNTMYAPHFRSWHTAGCDDYEADVTYNMLQHLYGRKARQLDTMRRNRPGRYEHPINFERRIINETYKGLEAPREFYGTYFGDTDSIRRIECGGNKRSNALSSRKAIDYYPVSYHRESARSAPHGGRTDMTVSSHFQYTQPSVRGSYVIHPDFVSEHTEFSKNLKHTKSATCDRSFRYGSKTGC